MALSTNPDAIRHLPGALLLNLGKISNLARQIHTHHLKLTTPDSWFSAKCCIIKQTHLDPHNKKPWSKVNMNTSHIHQRLILPICSRFHSSKCSFNSFLWSTSFSLTDLYIAVTAGWAKMPSSFLTAEPTRLLIMRSAAHRTHVTPQKVCGRAHRGGYTLFYVCVSLHNNHYIGIPGVQTQLAMCNNVICLFASLSELLISEPSAVTAIERPDKNRLCVAVIMLLTRTSQAC